MREDRVINVFYHERLVGTLAMTNERKAAFEYADEWLENGFSISPFSLPLEKKVCVPVKNYFNGLWGVFADSLPDAWGQLLLDRMLKEKGHNIDNVSMLDRLAIVGESGMGALHTDRNGICQSRKNSAVLMNYLNSVRKFLILNIRTSLMNYTDLVEQAVEQDLKL